MQRKSFIKYTFWVKPPTFYGTWARAFVFALLHFEFFTTPSHGSDAHITTKLYLGHHSPMDIHNDNLSGIGTKIHLLIIGRPNTASDGRIQVKHGGPVSLSCYGTNQDKTILKMVDLLFLSFFFVKYKLLGNKLKPFDRRATKRNAWPGCFGRLSVRSTNVPRILSRRKLCRNCRKTPVFDKVRSI